MRLPGTSSPCGLVWGPLLLGLSGLLVASLPQLVREGPGGMGQVALLALLPSRADPASFFSVSASPGRCPPIA